MGRFNQDKNVNHDHHPSDHQEQDYHLSAKGKQSSSGLLNHPITTLPLQNPTDLSGLRVDVIKKKKTENKKSYTEVIDLKVIDNCPGQTFRNRLTIHSFTSIPDPTQSFRITTSSHRKQVILDHHSSLRRKRRVGWKRCGDKCWGLS
ncbi:hypothetical protein H4Q26_005216 [Puccinia striiformis f. sp. tritici PST-130]|nr:hypothetical protein H4Q26_005216 [Puccinia striiformis f. sp. tritici PST-130]